MKSIDVTGLLPQYHPRTNNPINYKVGKETVIVSCIQRGKRNQLLPNQNQPKDIEIPRFINLNEDLGESLGLYFGDGTKKDIGLEFSNSSPHIMDLWLKHLKTFDINEDKINYIAKVSINSKIKYNVTEDEIKTFWCSSLDIEKTKIIIQWVKSKGKPSTYLKKYGTLVIRYYDSLFSVFYNTLLENLPTFLEENEQFRVGFLRGLVAAEGNINIKKNGSLGLFRIAGDSNTRVFISNLLSNFFNIHAKEDKSNQLYFSGFKNFQIVKDLDLHTLHPEKAKSFEDGYEVLKKNLNRKSDKYLFLKNKRAINILISLRESPKSYSDLEEIIKVSPRYLRLILKGGKNAGNYWYYGLLHMGLVLRNKDKGVMIWRITEKGKKFLKDLKK